MRRLADMNVAEPEQPWFPELDLENDEEYEQTLPVDGAPPFVQHALRVRRSRYGQLVDWAVVQIHRDGARWRRIAVYDACHGKGMHVHLYNSQQVDFAQITIRPVHSYQDMEECLQEAIDRVRQHWQDNKRRSDHGR